MAERIMKKMIICGHCSLACADMDTLKEHMRNAHVKDGSFDPSMLKVLPTTQASVTDVAVGNVSQGDISHITIQAVDELGQTQEIIDEGTQPAAETHTMQIQVEDEVMDTGVITADNDTDDVCIEEGEEEATTATLAANNKQTVLIVRQLPDGTHSTSPGESIQLTQSQIQELISGSLTMQTEQRPITRAKRLQVLDAENVQEMEEHYKRAHEEGEKTIQVVDDEEGTVQECEEIQTSDEREYIYPISEPQNDDEHRISFKFKMAMNETELAFFPDHITPVVQFKCSYCDYKDTNVKKTSLHVRNIHSADSGDSTATRSNQLSEQYENQQSVQCPCCLLTFDNRRDRDRHRKTKCGSKKRYEIKRQAVRTLQKHLICQVASCARDLYLVGTHRAEINYPRQVFAVSHRTINDKHYFTCYVCAFNSHQPWREVGNDAIKRKIAPFISSQLNALRERQSLATVQIPEESSLAHLNVSPLTHDMMAFDFNTWPELANHVADMHTDFLMKPPVCTICNITFKNTGSLCIHLFTNEDEFIQHHVKAISHRSKMHNSEKYCFGLAPGNNADKMLFELEPDDASSRVKLGSKYSCKTCGKLFTCSTTRDKHVISNACVKLVIDGEKKHECQYCKRRFHTRKTYITHEVWCGYKDRRKKLMAEKDTGVVDGSGDGGITISVEDEGQPQIKRARPTNYKCDVPGCVIGFEDEQEMDIHKACHIKDTLALKCIFCEHRTASNIAWFPLKEHIIAKHPGHIKPKYNCTLCDKGFAKKSKYDDHMTTHSEIKAFSCIECGALFKQESGLRAHVQTEHTPAEFKEEVHTVNTKKKVDQPVLLCYVCGYSTKSRSYFHTHMNIHKGIKPYNCKSCDYKTVDSACYRRHMWRHREDKPYKCPYCSFDGIQRSQIASHMKTKHSVYGDNAKHLIKRRFTHGNSSLTQPVPEQHTVTVISSSDLDAAQIEEQGQPITGTTAVSIVNPDGTETTIPVELITQAAEGMSGGNVQVSYGDYMVNYTLQTNEDDTATATVIEEQAIE